MPKAGAKGSSSSRINSENAWREGQSSRIASEFHQKASKLWIRHCNASVPAFMLVRTCLCREWWHYQQSFWKGTLTQRFIVFSHRRVSILFDPLHRPGTKASWVALSHWQHSAWRASANKTLSPDSLFGLQPIAKLQVPTCPGSSGNNSNFKSWVLLPDHKSGHVFWCF